MTTATATHHRSISSAASGSSKSTQSQGNNDVQHYCNAATTSPTAITPRDTAPQTTPLMMLRRLGVGLPTALDLEEPSSEAPRLDLDFYGVDISASRSIAGRSSSGAVYIPPNLV